VAAPRRVAADGTTYQSVIKPRDERAVTHSVDFEGGGRATRRVIMSRERSTSGCRKNCNNSPNSKNT